MFQQPALPDEAKALIIVGLHSSGKSTLAAAVARVLGGAVVEMGDVVRRAARARGGRHLVLVAEQLLNEDPLAIARSAVRLAARRRAPVTVVGPRTAEELHFLLSAFPAAVVIGLDAASDLRRKRWARRHLSYADTWEERETREAKWGTADLLQSCDLVLASSDNLDKQLGAVLRHLEAVRP